jgi:hypothetical protein
VVRVVVPEAEVRSRDTLGLYVRRSCLAIIHADPLFRNGLDMRTTRLGFQRIVTTRENARLWWGPC